MAWRSGTGSTLRHRRRLRCSPGDLPPALTVDSGDTIVLRSLNAAGHLRPQTFLEEAVPEMAGQQRRGHCLTGPIAVRGAVPGQVLAVRFMSLRPDPGAIPLPLAATPR